MSVSAIIANCYRAELVGIALENLLQQAILPHQIIVVDNESTNRSAEAGVPVDRITQAIFRTSIRKHLPYVRNVGASVQLSVQRLTAEVKKSPAAWLALTELWLRIIEHMRHAGASFRWLSAYRAGVADRRQLALIRELGFNVVPPHS
jgi:hypothetical protein